MENRHPRLGLRRRYRSNQCLKAVESPVWAADCIKGGDPWIESVSGVAAVCAAPFVFPEVRMAHCRSWQRR